MPQFLCSMADNSVNFHFLTLFSHMHVVRHVLICIPLRYHDILKNMLVQGLSNESTAYEKSGIHFFSNIFETDNVTVTEKLL